jgi:hypothetical protein
MENKNKPNKMITNLAVSVVVSFVTNTTEIMPQKAVIDPNPVVNGVSDAMLRTHIEPVKDPKEKWVKTTISETTTYSFVHNGQPLKQAETRELTNWTTYFVLAPPPPPRWLEHTNNIPVPLAWPLR